MSDLVKWAKWCHDNNVKAEVQREMYKAADKIERQAKRIAELEAQLALPVENLKVVRDLLATNERLRAVYEAAKRLTTIWGLEDTAYADVERYMGDLEMEVAALKGADYE